MRAPASPFFVVKTSHKKYRVTRWTRVAVDKEKRTPQAGALLSRHQNKYSGQATGASGDGVLTLAR